MNVDKLNVAFLSDVHLFHSRTDTVDIVNEIKNEFDYHNKDIDILYIGGDFFDKVVTLSREVAGDALDCIYYLLYWARDTDTQLRILKGTPSHDWNQNTWFVRINELSGINADLQYFPELSIEYNSRYDINVLYVPDEWLPDTNDTLNQVKELLRSKGLDQVDLAIMHGNFHYQLPEIAKAPKHNEQEYLSIVKYLISIGHVHKHSHYERIIAQGSFSRLAHGEEEPKGYVKATLYKDGKYEWQFIENVNATKYISIDITDHTVKSAHKLIDKKVANLPDFTHVRIVANRTHAILKDMDSIIRKYPTLKWTHKVIDNNTFTVDDTHTPTDFTGYNVITLTRDNIVEQVINRLNDKGIELNVQSKAKVTMEEILNEL